MSKKFLCLLCVCLTFSLLLNACKAEASKAVIYESDDGELVQIEVSDGFFQDGESPFAISKDGDTYLEGSFATSGLLDFYSLVVDEDESMTMIERSEKDGNEYIFYRVDYSYTLAEDNNLDIDRAGVKFSGIGNSPKKAQTSSPGDLDGGNNTYTEYAIIVEVADTNVSIAMAGIQGEEATRAAFDAMAITTVD